MRKLTISVCVATLLGFGVFFAVGMAGLAIFPCERAQTSPTPDGGDAVDAEPTWTEASCRVGQGRARYGAVAYAMGAGMFGLLPLLPGFMIAVPLTRKEVDAVGVGSRIFGILGAAAGAFGLVQVGMRGQRAGWEEVFIVLGAAAVLSLIAALTSRGANWRALLGPLLVVLTLVAMNVA